MYSGGLSRERKKWHAQKDHMVRNKHFSNTEYRIWFKKRIQYIWKAFVRNLRTTLHWRHNNPDDVSNHQPHGCLLNRLFRRRSKKTSKFRVTGLFVGNSPGPVNSPHKGPGTRKCFHLMTSSCIVSSVSKEAHDIYYTALSIQAQ